MYFAQVILCLVIPVYGVLSADSNDFVSDQELTEVKEEMERRVDQLHSQLHYWQNVTINILKDQCSSNTDTEKLDTVIAITERMSNRLDSLEDSLLKICHVNETLGSFFNPANNCSHILAQHPGSSSGYYWIQSSPGYVVKVYCDMERVCGCGEGGGWMRVADIDMTRPNQTCPTGFRQITTTDGKTICGAQSSVCTGATFSSKGLLYSRVCGRIVAYQFGRTNGLLGYTGQSRSLDSNFVDGIVLTHGSPCSHIWTFVAGHDQISATREDCPCNTNSYSYQTPPYVGNDYFCDSAHTQNTQPPLSYLTGDPLWDGQGCVSGSCCSFNNPPWFCKTLTTPTTDDIDLRLCLDDVIADEDVLFEMVEIYVQ